MKRNNTNATIDTNNKNQIMLLQVSLDDLFHNEMCWVASSLAGSILSSKKKFDESEMYVLDVFRTINKIHDCFLSIDRAKLFIDKLPSVKKLDKIKGMTIVDYYVYHYDVVIHKLSTIRDLTYKLINDVFNIGLDRKSCNWKNIKCHYSEIKIPGLFNVQQLFYYCMTEMESERNISTHEGGIELPFLDELDMFVTYLQMVRLGKIPDYNIHPQLWELNIINKEQNSCHIKLIERICFFENVALSFVHILTCCMSNSFRERIKDSLKCNYKEVIEQADNIVSSYQNKVVYLDNLLPWLIEIDNITKRLYEEKKIEKYYE